MSGAVGALKSQKVKEDSTVAEQPQPSGRFTDRPGTITFDTLSATKLQRRHSFTSGETRPAGLPQRRVSVESRATHNHSKVGDVVATFRRAFPSADASPTKGNESPVRPTRTLGAGASGSTVIVEEGSDDVAYALVKGELL